jgi:hypothetical protein
MRDVNFKDSDLPNLSIEDYKITTDETGKHTRLIPKDTVNHAVLDDEGYEVSTPKAEVRQAMRDGEEDAELEAQEGHLMRRELHSEEAEDGTEEKFETFSCSACGH